MAVLADYIRKERATPKPDAVFAFILRLPSLQVAVRESVPRLEVAVNCHLSGESRQAPQVLRKTRTQF